MLWATRLPLIVLLVGLGALAMLVPAVHAYVTRDLVTARAFLYSCVMFLFLFTMIALGTSNYNIRRQGRSHLISLFALFAALPAMLAVPFSEVVTDTTFGNAYIEMVSSLTTTGLTLFEADRLPPSVHLWRALVGWLGGFFMWVAAIAVFAPLNLAGLVCRAPCADLWRADGRSLGGFDACRRYAARGDLPRDGDAVDVRYFAH
jgi:trk system potassium uptake protein TrkH